MIYLLVIPFSSINSHNWVYSLPSLLGTTLCIPVYSLLKIVSQRCLHSLLFLVDILSVHSHMCLCFYYPQSLAQQKDITTNRTDPNLICENQWRTLSKLLPSRYFLCMVKYENWILGVQIIYFFNFWRNCEVIICPEFITTMEECFRWLTERCYGLAKATSKWPSPSLLPCLLFDKKLNPCCLLHSHHDLFHCFSFLFVFFSSSHCLLLLVSLPSVCCLFSTSLIWALSRTVSSAVPVVYGSRGGCN